ncbi:MAG: alpha-amylase family glycosyl hydrolase [Verrucomicrobiota bacterium JB024]|nr:alpha-amylase family glycosyl hydrolase [Verrucomicrobiota bacterium JB024]
MRKDIPTVAPDEWLGEAPCCETPLRLRPARPAADHVPEMMIYQIWLRSFTPEGTLRAAKDRLEYVAELGANTVYLSPISKHSEDARPQYLSPRTSQSSAGHVKNPYRISDYDTVEPEYGTEEDLRAFIAEAHRLGLRVLMDLVYFHSSADSVLLKDPEFHVRDENGEPVLGDWNFPVLNFESANLRRCMIGNMLHWVRDCGADGFRCDVSYGVPSSFWEEARYALEAVKPDIVMLAESEVPQEQLKAFDLSYNFSYYLVLYDVMRKGHPATRLREQWEIKRSKFPAGARHAYFCDNHDKDRVDVVFGYRGAEVVAALMFALDGIPFVYNGQEIADATPDDVMSRETIRWDLADEPSRRERTAFFRDLFAVRRRERVLTHGVLKWMANSAPDAVLTFTREDGARKLLVAVNLSNRNEIVDLDCRLSEETPLLERRWSRMSAPGGSCERLCLRAYGFLVAAID